MTRCSKTTVKLWIDNMDNYQNFFKKIESEEETSRPLSAGEETTSMILSMIEKIVYRPRTLLK